VRALQLVLSVVRLLASPCSPPAAANSQPTTRFRSRVARRRRQRCRRCCCCDCYNSSSLHLLLPSLLPSLLLLVAAHRLASAALSASHRHPARATPRRPAAHTPLVEPLLLVDVPLLPLLDVALVAATRRPSLHRHHRRCTSSQHHSSCLLASSSFLLRTRRLRTPLALPRRLVLPCLHVSARLLPRMRLLLLPAPPPSLPQLSLTTALADSTATLTRSYPHAHTLSQRPRWRLQLCLSVHDPHACALVCSPARLLPRLLRAHLAHRPHRFALLNLLSCLCLKLCIYYMARPRVYACMLARPSIHDCASLHSTFLSSLSSLHRLHSTHDCTLLAVAALSVTVTHTVMRIIFSNTRLNVHVDS
jgi:hypothetical protein